MARNQVFTSNYKGFFVLKWTLSVSANQFFCFLVSVTVLPKHSKDIKLTKKCRWDVFTCLYYIYLSQPKAKQTVTNIGSLILIADRVVHSGIINWLNANNTFSTGHNCTIYFFLLQLERDQTFSSTNIGASDECLFITPLFPLLPPSCIYFPHQLYFYKIHITSFSRFLERISRNKSITIAS